MPAWMIKLAGWIATMLKEGDITVSGNDLKNNLHISTSKDGKKLIVKNTGSGTVNVQQINIGTENKEDVLELLKKNAFENDIVFLQDDSQKILTSISELEKSSEIKDIIDFFTGVLPLNDLIILRSGLYIRHLRSIGDQQGQKLKSDIVSRYGEHGKNIVNLATADYFETYIKPLYEQMSQDPEFSLEQFLKEYRVIVSEVPFAIFVNSGMNFEDVIKEFNDKAKRQIKYDVDEDVIALHGYGHNSDTIALAKAELSKLYDTTEDSYFSGVKIVIVKVYYKKKTLNAPS